jgi:hypothetical protein
MLAGIAAVRAGLQKLAAGDPCALSPDQLAGYLTEITAAQAELAAIQLAAVAEADARNLGGRGHRHGRLDAGPAAGAPRHRPPPPLTPSRPGRSPACSATYRRSTHPPGYGRSRR